MNQLTWRSKDLGDFIEAASQLVCTDVHVHLDIVQSNCREIADMALAWCRGKIHSYKVFQKPLKGHMNRKKIFENSKSLISRSNLLRV